MARLMPQQAAHLNNVNFPFFFIALNFGHSNGGLQMVFYIKVSEIQLTWGIQPDWSVSILVCSESIHSEINPILMDS